MKYCKIAEKYIDDVVNDRLMVGELVKLTYQRHLNDLETAPEKSWYFDKEAAERVMKFFSLLKHTKGRRFVNKPFVLEPWQCAIIYCIFGWKNADGTRRFAKSYTEIPKKNGKTAFAAGIADFLLGFDDEAEAEVYCAATKKDQAKICFNQAKAYIEKNQQLKAHLGAKFVTNNVSLPALGNKMEPLGRDSLGLDGINPSGAIIDEYHEWKTDDVLESIESATVAREQSLVFIITTAGLNKTHPCFEFRNFCIDILRGIKQQDDTFAVIYSLDEGDDWKDPKNWAKANPNFGISVIPEKMQSECDKAINQGGAKETSFKTKNLNLWVDAPTVWIQDEHIVAANYGTTPENFKGCECYVGVDLASKEDITAVAMFYPDVNGRAVAKFHYWIPEQKVIDKNDRVDYRLWSNSGYITVTPGNLIDTEIFKNEFLSMISGQNIKFIGYDPWGAEHGFVQALEELGLFKKLDKVEQTAKNLTPATKKISELLVGRKIDLLGDPVIRWMFRNVQILMYDNNLMKPDRKRSTEKIDGVAALANAITSWLSTGEIITPYANHAPRELNF